MPWLNETPRIKKKSDLRGLPLTVKDEFPPERTRTGMHTLVVFDEGNKGYEILVTRKNIDDIIELAKDAEYRGKFVNQGVWFTFDDSEYGEVVKVAPVS
jgi:hypothetical protein